MFGGHYDWGDVVHGVSFRAGTTVDPFYSPSIVVRALCYAMIDQIPDPGLPEVCQSLFDLQEYYSLPPTPANCLPEQVSPASWGPNTVRPEFYVDEDD